MKPEKVVLKRCTRCGHKLHARQSYRRCHQLRFGKGSYTCWGNLETVKKKPKPITEEDSPQMYEAQRKKAELQRQAAERMVSAKTRALARLVTSLRMYERRASYYAKRAAMTDAELAAEKLKRADRPTKVRRAMKVGGK